MMCLVEIKKEKPEGEKSVESIVAVEAINKVIDKLESGNEVKAVVKVETTNPTKTNDKETVDNFELRQIVKRRISNVKKGIRTAMSVLDGLGALDTYKRLKYTARLNSYTKERDQLECYLFGLEKGISEKELNKLYKVVLK